MVQKEITRNQFTLQNAEDADTNGNPTPVPQTPSFVGSGKDSDLEKAETPPPGVPKEGATMDSQILSQALQDLPPPDGGLKAWMQVLGAHAVVMVTW